MASANGSVRGVGSIIVVLGMIGAIFGIGNHLNQRMNYMAEGSKTEIVQFEKTKSVLANLERRVASHKAEVTPLTSDIEHLEDNLKEIRTMMLSDDAREALQRRVESIEEWRIWWNRNRLTEQSENASLVKELQRRLTRLEDILLKHNCGSSTTSNEGH